MAWPPWRTLTTIIVIWSPCPFPILDILLIHARPSQDFRDWRGCSALTRIYTQFPLRADLQVIPLQGTMRFLSPILLASVLQVTQVALAYHIELPSRSDAALPNLLSRAPNATSGLDDDGGAYYINITLGGKEFSVLIDTGR